jgi:3',5'-nucleoside bisphosphate phosphatase
VIDLHLHTTASDGRLSPSALVDRAWREGLRTIAVADHDTVAGIAEARAAAASFGLRLVTGTEITAIVEGSDVHLLAYFVDDTNPRLGALLASQRERRVERVREMAERLEALGCPVDVQSILAVVNEHPERSVGRPAVAHALVRAGHVPDVPAAFNLWLGYGRPGWVPRSGPSPRQVIEAVSAAGGLVSLAHPVLGGQDAAIPGWVEEGLAALEVFHPEHGPEDVARYAGIARDLDLLVTGGSDFHGDRPDGSPGPIGACTLPAEHFERFAERASGRRR